MLPWTFLAVALVGAWFTWNAHHPTRARGPLIVPSFFAGWLTSELAAHHVAWQVLATLAFVWAGALQGWPGWVALGVTLASWAGMLRLREVSARAEPVVEEALCRGLGPGYREEISEDLARGLAAPLHRSRRAVPFLLMEREVERVGNLAYAPEHGFRGLLDVYRPRGGVRGAPVLLQVHGGAWMISQKRHQALPLMLHLARAGWVCVSANYRLSPKVAFPAHLVDLKRALVWTREHVAGYGGDPDLICVTGGSAGGHLSAMLALTAGDPEYQPGFEGADTSVAACVPFYGVYDFTDHYGKHLHGGIRSFMERIVLKTPLEGDRESWLRASPMHRIHADAPPFFVVHGSHDSLTPVEEARHFVELLRKTSREPVCFAEVPGAQHAFETFHSLRSFHVVRGVERFLAWVVARERARRAGGAAQAPRASGSATTSMTT